jgi:hypothetical protein
MASKSDLVNKELLVPGRVFPDEKLAPSKKGWTARTTKMKDAKNVYVKFPDDNQLYFFPVSEVKTWVVGDWEGAITPSPKKQPCSFSPSEARAASSSGKRKTMKELTKRAAPSRGGKSTNDEEINANTEREEEEEEEDIAAAMARPSPLMMVTRVKAGRRRSLSTTGGAAAKKAVPGGGRMGTLVRDIMYFLLGMVGMYVVLLYAFSQT